MFKRIIAIISSLILLITITGCSESINKVEAEGPLSSLNAETMYLEGTYECRWDATEKFVRDYYKLDTEKEFIKPTSTFLIKLNLEINKDGSYKLYSEDAQTPFMFDLFLTDDTLSEIELQNLFDGDSTKWTKYRNEQGTSFKQQYKEITENFKIENYSINESDKFTINGKTIALKDNSGVIEAQNNIVRIKFESNNTYTNNEIYFIKK